MFQNSISFIYHIALPAGSKSSGFFWSVRSIERAGFEDSRAFCHFHTGSVRNRRVQYMPVTVHSLTSAILGENALNNDLVKWIVLKGRYISEWKSFFSWRLESLLLLEIIVYFPLEKEVVYFKPPGSNVSEVNQNIEKQEMDAAIMRSHHRKTCQDLLP